MKKVYPILFSFVFFLIYFPLTAQEAEPESAGEEETEVFHPHHAVGLVIGHANVREGVTAGGNRWLSLPSWGIDYNYYFHPRWSIGLHTDFIVEEFAVEKHLHGGEEAEVIDRNFPIAPAVVAGYSFARRPRSAWAVEFGAGAEFAGGGEETFFVNRLGIEYGVEIHNHWELYAVLTYDIKWNGYDSFVIGLGVAKALGMPHEEHKEGTSH